MLDANAHKLTRFAGCLRRRSIYGGRGAVSFQSHFLLFNRVDCETHREKDVADGVIKFRRTLDL